MDIDCGSYLPPPDAGVTSNAVEAVSGDEIKEQLSRILDSTGFRATERVRHLLRYIVEESLEGRADRLKGYTIGIEVFGRGVNFDAQQDPVVRAEASHLRQALERYYLVAGEKDPIVISVPKGGYKPVFERIQTTADLDNANAKPRREDDAFRRVGGAAFVVLSVLIIGLLAGWIASSELTRDQSARARAAAPGLVSPTTLIGKPIIRVEPFTNSGSGQPSEDFRAGLTAEVVNQLVKFKNLSVIVGVPQTRKANGALPQVASADFVLTGSVRGTDEHIRVWTQLMDSMTGAVLWSHTYDKQLTVGNLLAAQEDIAANVAVTLGQPSGMLAKDGSATGRPFRDDITAYTCILSYYTYRVDYDRRRHADVRGCLERTVVQFPEYATAWALLAMTYIDEDRFGYNPANDRQPPIFRALKAGNRAVALDPTDARGLQALMMASFLNQDVAKGKEIGDRAVELNPNDMTLVGEYGVLIALAGDRKRGAEMIHRAMNYDASNGNLYTQILALVAYFDRDIAKAARLVDAVNIDNNPIALLTACAIYGQAGRTDDAELAKRKYVAMGTHHLENLEREMSKRNLSPSDKAYYVDGLRKAGLPVPEDVVARYANQSQSESVSSSHLTG